jgi:uncharacterized protein (TIGR02996 family)
MTLEQLLSCLNQTPGDDLLWLALADCLEEGGQPDRAELVRLNRWLRGMPEGDKRWAVERRVCELITGGVVPCVPEVVNSIGMRLALIPAGKFWMGSPEDEEGRQANEGPRHLVEIKRPMWVGAFPVTQAQYEAVMGTNPSYFSATGGGAEEVVGLDTRAFPVELVSWDDAIAFCHRLSSRPEEIASRYKYRLPTEAEWEYACRAGIWSAAFHFGDAPDKALANFDLGPLRPSEVCCYPPNAWGLYDMHGNVVE